MDALVSQPSWLMFGPAEFVCLLGPEKNVREANC